MPCTESEAINLEVLVLRRGMHRFATAKLKDILSVGVNKRKFT